MDISWGAENQVQLNMEEPLSIEAPNSIPKIMEIIRITIIHPP